MALEKEMISNNGAIEAYHRIASVSNDHGLVTVTIVSYVDKEHRELEIDITTKQRRQLALGSQIAEMCEVPPEERSADYEAVIQELQKEEASYGPEIWQAGQLYSSEHVYELDMTSYADITFEAIYEELSKLDIFDGSSISDIETPYKLEQRIEALETKKPALTSPYTDNKEPTGIASRYYEVGELIAIYDDTETPITVMVVIPISYCNSISIGVNVKQYYGFV